MPISTEMRRLRAKWLTNNSWPKRLDWNPAGGDIDDQLTELHRVARAFEATGGHIPEPRNGGRSGCFCCSATHELAPASLLKPAYLPGRVPSSLT